MPAPGHPLGGPTKKSLAMNANYWRNKASTPMPPDPIMRPNQDQKVARLQQRVERLFAKCVIAEIDNKPVTLAVEDAVIVKQLITACKGMLGG